MTQHWLPQTYHCKVQPSHIDRLGHMNNAAYLQIFEDARWQMISERGYGIDTIHRLNLGPVILAVEVQFRKEVLLGAELRIESLVSEYQGKIGKIKQTMMSGTDITHAVAIFTVGLFDLQQRKLVLPTKEWLAACGHVD